MSRRRPLTADDESKHRHYLRLTERDWRADRLRAQSDSDGERSPREDAAEPTKTGGRSESDSDRSDSSVDAFGRSKAMRQQRTDGTESTHRRPERRRRLGGGVVLLNIMENVLSSHRRTAPPSERPRGSHRMQFSSGGLLPEEEE
jgi:hypothetical protein